MLVAGEDDAATALGCVCPNVGDAGEQRAGGSSSRTNGHHVVHEVAAADALLNHVQKLCAVSWTQRLEHGIISLIRHKNPLCLFMIVGKA